jgi:inward rectifier potassium channel
MQKPGFDPGLTQQFTGTVKRFVNQDGRFNVRRSGLTWKDAHPYLFLISTSWRNFVLIVGLAYFIVNTIFATLYMAIGIEQLKGAQGATLWQSYLNAFFFSAHTLTTVGYGNMWPNGPLANAVAACEALAGLMAFAIATGLVFGRFSRPSARIAFSRNMIVTPYMDGTSLQFRVLNRRSNNIIELEARLMLMTVETVAGQMRRQYARLELERSDVLFFPLTWTVVHPIDEASPLYGKTAADLERMQAELMILLKGFDETFGQTVHARNSYRYDEIIWGARFAPAFTTDSDGQLRLEIDRVGDVVPAPLPVPQEKMAELSSTN